MTIGIYGLGRFGTFWSKTLLSGGNKVYAYSRSPHTVSSGVEMVSEKEVLSKDLLFYCVSISKMDEVLKRTSPYMVPSTIVMDTCSVKTYPISLMEKYIPSNIYTIGIHPMFGPDSAKDGIKGLPIIMCNIKEKNEKYEMVKSLFESMSLRVLEMSADEHDKKAAFSQGVTHFIGRVLSEMHLTPTEIATKGYNELLEIVNQTCNDSEELFHDLQHYNPYTREMRHSLRLAIENVGYKIGDET